MEKLCHTYGLKPSKNYGQNFLISAEPIEIMLEAAELKSTDTVVEVGPGFGVLTLPLSLQVKKVFAFEIEKKLAPFWQKECQKQSNIEIIWGNVLHQFADLAPNLPKNYKVVANLPYQITSAVIRLFLESPNPPTQLVLMVQKEVAERICAGKGKMSILAVSVQYYAEAMIVAQVPRQLFWPAPQVDSAILLINVGQKTKVERLRTNDFFRVVKAGFSSPRKMLWKNLASGLKIEGAEVKKILKEVCGSDMVRAEMLEVAEWSLLTEKLEIRN